MVHRQFLEANWFRATRKSVHAKVLAPFLAEELRCNLPCILGEKAEIVVHEQQGWFNLCYIVKKAGGEEYILRLQPRPENPVAKFWSVYHKEAWAMRHVPAEVPIAGLPDGGVGYLNLASGPRGELQSYAYMLQFRLPYRPASELVPCADKLAFLYALGRIAQALNRTPARGYGAAFDADTESFRFSSWSDYVEAEIAKQRIMELAERGVLSFRVAEIVTERLQALARLEFEPRLAHLDFVNNWSNVLVDEQLRIKAVIDWEFAFAGPAAHYEIASTLYAMSRDGHAAGDMEAEIEAFLGGYGLSLAEYRSRYEFDVRTVMIINALSAVNKYLTLRSNGGLTREPWRRRFAARARRMIERCCACDGCSVFTRTENARRLRRAA